ncbi:hypothetical protein G6D95_000518 [Salmonella enterica]|nr:hypothetical protein [Salmonella enterica]EIC8290894.1 hypothetical protein [Salmonella enterica]ELO8296808.1 hypothetical protein [Salmonella enterica]ELT4076366.1 hypothetical protein [Salmonella enterica]
MLKVTTMAGEAPFTACTLWMMFRVNIVVATIDIAALPGKSNFVIGMRGDVLSDVTLPIFSPMWRYGCGSSSAPHSAPR